MIMAYYNNGRGVFFGGPSLRLPPPWGEKHCTIFNVENMLNFEHPWKCNLHLKCTPGAPPLPLFRFVIRNWAWWYCLWKHWSNDAQCSGPHDSHTAGDAFIPSLQTALLGGHWVSNISAAGSKILAYLFTSQCTKVSLLAGLLPDPL